MTWTADVKADGSYAVPRLPAGDITVVASSDSKSSSLEGGRGAIEEAPVAIPSGAVAEHSFDLEPGQILVVTPRFPRGHAYKSIAYYVFDGRQSPRNKTDLLVLRRTLPRSSVHYASHLFFGLDEPVTFEAMTSGPTTLCTELGVEAKGRPGSPDLERAGFACTTVEIRGERTQVSVEVPPRRE
jgi:hypothetical protein